MAQTLFRKANLQTMEAKMIETSTIYWKTPGRKPKANTIILVEHLIDGVEGYDVEHSERWSRDDRELLRWAYWPMVKERRGDK